MLLNLKMGKRGDLIAHITLRGEKAIALYDRTEPNPGAGPVDVVVVGQSTDGRRLFVARKAGLIPVAHDGFALSGNMCSTLAWAPAYNKTVSPGQAPVYVADRMGLRWSDPRRPGTVFCRPADFRPGKPIRAYGVDLDQADLRVVAPAAGSALTAQ